MGLDRVRVVSSGHSGAPGYTNFYFGTITSASLTALRTLFDAVKGFVPNTVTFTFPSAGDTIDETDGHLIGGWAVAAGAPVIGTSAGNYSPASGFGINWRPAGVIDGHRPIAKTFFVPGGSNVYTGAGALAPALTTAVNAAALAFLASSTSFSLWHRPVKASAGPPPVAASPGGAFPIVSGACAPKVFILRSRRD